MDSAQDNPCSHGLGSPIRISPDHWLLAPPRSFSQLATSFFAYLRQGIHTHALSSLTIKFTLNSFTLKLIQSHSMRALVCTYTFFARARQTCICPSIFNCQRSYTLERLTPALNTTLPLGIAPLNAAAGRHGSRSGRIQI